MVEGVETGVEDEVLGLGAMFARYLERDPASIVAKKAIKQWNAKNHFKKSGVGIVIGLATSAVNAGAGVEGGPVEAVVAAAVAVGISVEDVTEAKFGKWRKLPHSKDPKKEAQPPPLLQPNQKTNRARDWSRAFKSTS